MKIIFFLTVLLFVSCNLNNDKIKKSNKEKSIMEFPVNKSESEWKKELSDSEYYVLRQKGTERPFSGEYDNHYEKGTYVCKGCGIELFTAETKFDGHCGWPSFYDAINKTNIKEIPDYSHGMTRIEVVCGNCGGHLGHVFDDGPNPTGLRYCINSVSLGFISENEYDKSKDSLDKK